MCFGDFSLMRTLCDAYKEFESLQRLGFLLFTVYELAHNNWNRNWMEIFERAGFMSHSLARVNFWK